MSIAEETLKENMKRLIDNKKGESIDIREAFEDLTKAIPKLKEIQAFEYNTTENYLDGKDD